jgi:hypothetical protein
LRTGALLWIFIEIRDKDLSQKIKPLLKKNRVLEAVGVCMQFYKSTHKNITFKDCFTLVTNIYNNQN